MSFSVYDEVHDPIARGVSYVSRAIIEQADVIAEEFFCNNYPAFTITQLEHQDEMIDAVINEITKRLLNS